MADSAKPGWYPDHESPDRVRWWDGQRWMDRTLSRQEHARRTAEGTDPSLYWMLGLLLSLTGGVLAVVADDESIVILASICAAFGWVLLMVGIIATGVSIGMRHRDAYNRRHDLY